MRRVQVSRLQGRLILRIEEHGMGKKADAYNKAVQAEGIAKNRWSDVQGGSTKEAYNEALNNAIQAERNSNDTWNAFIEDPEG
jgi:hypothetical protein